MKITILGCGASTGVPVIGCDCLVCQSDNPKNKRRRVSVYVQTAHENILIDTSPDLRMQALDNNIRQVDAVLYTHDHGDHTHGIDELRRFNYLAQDFVPIYGDAHTLELLTTRFAYAFRPPIPEYGWTRTALRPHAIIAGEAFRVGETQVLPFRQEHGVVDSVGYRIGDFAYSTDVKTLPDDAFKALEGVKLWVVDCQGYEPFYTHAHLELTLSWIAKVKPQLAVLTHMGHGLDYETLKRELPDGIVPAYDNMVVDNIA